MSFKKYTFAAVIFMLFAFGCSNTPAVIVKTGSGEQTITAKAGKPFSVLLESQLSTGYGWKLSDTPAPFSIIKEDVITEGGNKAGGIDTQEFVFKSSEKGDFVLTFKYARHWEKKPQYIKTATVKVRVE